MLDKKDRYKKGENPALDKGYSLYEKMSIFAGEAVDEALTDEEGNLLVKLWCKERERPRMMFTQEVSTLVEFSKTIIAWRENRKREKWRIRKERQRKKLREAAENNDAAAVKKLEKIKKAAAVVSANYRQRKREDIS